MSTTPNCGVACKLNSTTSTWDLTPTRLISSFALIITILGICIGHAIRLYRRPNKYEKYSDDEDTEEEVSVRVDNVDVFFVPPPEQMFVTQRDSEDSSSKNIFITQRKPETGPKKVARAVTQRQPEHSMEHSMDIFVTEGKPETGLKKGTCVVERHPTPVPEIRTPPRSEIWTAPCIFEAEHYEFIPKSTTHKRNTRKKGHKRTKILKEKLKEKVRPAASVIESGFPANILSHRLSPIPMDYLARRKRTFSDNSDASQVELSSSPSTSAAGLIQVAPAPDAEKQRRRKKARSPRASPKFEKPLQTGDTLESREQRNPLLTPVESSSAQEIELRRLGPSNVRRIEVQPPAVIPKFRKKAQSSTMKAQLKQRTAVSAAEVSDFFQQGKRGEGPEEQVPDVVQVKRARQIQEGAHAFENIDFRERRKAHLVDVDHRSPRTSTEIVIEDLEGQSEV